MPVFVVLRLIGAASLGSMHGILVLCGTMIQQSVMNVTSRIVFVDVHDRAHVGADWSRQCHAHGGRQGKHGRQHRPKDGVEPACSPHSAQRHAWTRNDEQPALSQITGGKYKFARSS